MGMGKGYPLPTGKGSREEAISPLQKFKKIFKMLRRWDRNREGIPSPTD